MLLKQNDYGSKAVYRKKGKITTTFAFTSRAKRLITT